MKDFEKFAEDFREIYNDAWSEFPDFTPIKTSTIRQSFRELKPIVDEKIIWFIKGGLLLNVNSDIMAFSFL